MHDPFWRRVGSYAASHATWRSAASVGFGPLSIMRARSRSPVPCLPREIGATVRRRVKWRPLLLSDESNGSCCNPKLTCILIHEIVRR